MKYLLIILTSCLAAVHAQAETTVRVFAMSKKSVPVEEKAEMTTHSNLLVTDTSIVVESSGKHFSPLMSSLKAQSTSGKTGLYKGQLMQQENSPVTGKLTGSILVKTSATLNIQGATASQFGSDYVLLTFEDGTELLTALSELKARSDVESAELEVNTRRYQAK